MQPIVLIGGGFNHYRMIQHLEEKHVKDRQLVLVAENHKLLALRHIPMLIDARISRSHVELDLWKACQRKSIYFLEDQCLHINREDSFVQLKNFGKLPFEKLSIETETLPQSLEDSRTTFSLGKVTHFLQEMQRFISEVRKHCPREVRIVMSGWRRETIEMAMALQQSLRGSCESCDIIILDEKPESKKPLFSAGDQSLIKTLKGWNIRVMQGVHALSSRPQWLELSDGTTLSFDIMIPMETWVASDSMGKILQGDRHRILVGRDLSDPRDRRVFVSGENVFFEREETRVSEIISLELSEVLLHNIFVAEDNDPRKTCRDLRVLDKFPLVSKSLLSWKSAKLETCLDRLKRSCIEEAKVLQSLPLQQKPQDDLKESLNYQTLHMSRPWKGLLSAHNRENSGNSYKLHSFNGFNSWGNYTQSAIKICEMALLKCLSKGVHPRQLRFNLTLPPGEHLLIQHIFESTFNAIESVTREHQVHIDGGDTFNGQFWHLNVTLGGEVFREPVGRFSPHDYLLMTRPLGFGFLWAGRLKDKFDSGWISRSLREKLAIPFEQYNKFVTRWNPSVEILIEEWGFLYHCMEQLPAHQQITLNFREIPRWEGIDQLLGEDLYHPGLDPNWERVEKDLAFKKEDVAKANSVLWDSMSQGGLVLGVRPEHWQEALKDLRGMGFSHSALVGCIRPKAKGQRVVLSDWSPK